MWSGIIVPLSLGEPEEMDPGPRGGKRTEEPRARGGDCRWSLVRNGRAEPHRVRAGTRAGRSGASGARPEENLRRLHDRVPPEYLRGLKKEHDPLVTEQMI